jgi:hypothetical protein
MYAQIVYKDKNLLELNNKILELERRLIDLQEFIGEKNEVIRGRDKVIQVIYFYIIYMYNSTYSKIFFECN